MKLNYLYKASCIDILKKEIEKNSVDLIFADPPYNLSGNGLKCIGNQTGGDWYMVNESWDKMSWLDYQNFTNEWIKESYKVLKDTGAIYVCCTYHNIAEVINALKKYKFKMNNIITWSKANAMPSMTRRTFTHSTEFIVWAIKEKNWIFNYNDLKKINPDKQKDGSLKQMRDVWNIPLVQGKERIKNKNGKTAHPTQKPEEILKRIIIASSNPEDIILDPFAGTGTTLYVAKQLKRKWIGIEKEAKYIDIIKKRLHI